MTISAQHSYVLFKKIQTLASVKSKVSISKCCWLQPNFPNVPEWAQYKQ